MWEKSLISKAIYSLCCVLVQTQDCILFISIKKSMIFLVQKISLVHNIWTFFCSKNVFPSNDCQRILFPKWNVLSHSIWIQSISSVFNGIRLILRLNFIEHYILMVWHFVKLSLLKHQNQIPWWNSTHHKIVQFRDILSNFFYWLKV